MSTRALYTFKDKDNSWNVYKHHDGYPEGAALAIANALTRAWELPRFEADEFACAFIAGNKTGGGGVRLMPQGAPAKVAAKHCCDIEFRYEVTAPKGKLHIKAFEVGATERVIFAGSLADFIAFANAE